MKKFLACILLSAIILSNFASCSETTVQPDDKAAVQNDSNPDTDLTGADETADTAEDENAELFSDLPTGNYDGWDFVMLNNISNYAYTLMGAEELTGDIVNDAVYNRNIKVADMLNINITEDRKEYADVTSAIKKEISSNTDTYACFWNECKFVAPFAASSSLINLNEITTLNLDKPWWNSSAMDDVTIADKLFFLAGDLHLMIKEAYWIVGFNKNMLDDYNLADPYELVREGKWTLPTMIEYMDTVDDDLNGDGKIDGSDQFGATCHLGCVRPLVFGSGEKVMEKDESGIPQIAQLSDRFYTVFTDIVNNIFANKPYIFIDGKTPSVSTYQLGFHDVFRQGHSLLYFEPVGSLKKLRDMEAEFGVVPFPKYDETQEKYISLIADSAAFCAVPVTNSDIERTGVVLENLCAESFGELNNAYAKSTLNFKYIRDEESIEMLNIIFENGTFNLADAIGITALADSFQNCASAGSTDLASKYASANKLSKKLLEKTLKGILGE